jgi:hypothetical protein
MIEACLLNIKVPKGLWHAKHVILSTPGTSITLIINYWIKKALFLWSFFLYDANVRVFML